MARGRGGSDGISVRQLERDAAAGSLATVYLIVGEEDALRRRAVAALQAAFDEDGEVAGPGTVTRLDAGSDGLSDVIDEARSLGLFAAATDRPVRMVWASGFDGADGTSQQLLEEYLASPVAATCLVFETSKLDRRRAFAKALAGGSVVVTCDPPRHSGDVRRFVERTLAERGFSIERDALTYLVEMSGARLTVLEQEMEKAMLSAGEGTIETSDLEGLLGRSHEHSIFELTDALVRGDRQAALGLLNALIDDGEQPLRILPMIAWITRQLVLAHDLEASGCSRQEAMEGIGGRWQQRGQILDRARRAQRARLMDALTDCAEADLFVKRLRDVRQGADRLRPARGRLEALCRRICAA